MKKLLLGLILLGAIYSQKGYSETITLVTRSGQEASFEIAPQDHFLDVMNSIQNYFYDEDSEMPPVAGERKILQLNFSLSNSEVTIRSKKKPWRSYKVGYSRKDKEDVSYIVNTLARESLISIGSSTSSLNKAGDRINHLHPFNFLLCIFTDEELKCGAHAIRDRSGLVSDRFFGGITTSLQEEHQQHNLAPFIADFAKKLNLDVNLITPVLNNCQWKSFVELLIDAIPRKNDPSRYNM